MPSGPEKCFSNKISPGKFRYSLFATSFALTNGLIRQYFPKGTDFATITDDEIKEVQRSLNDRPRAVLDYLKPNEVFNKLVALKI